MEKLNRGDKIYLDTEETEESVVNHYLEYRDSIIKVYEYIDYSGYGAKTRLFLCEDSKSESKNIVRQTWNDMAKKWIEEDMSFDSDSFDFLIAIVSYKEDQLGGKFSVIRDFTDNNYK